MGVMPEKRADQIVFCETHLPVWQAAPTALGLSVLLVDQLETLTLAARKSYTDAQAAREASKTATQAFYADTAAMRSLAAEMIAQIKAYADLQANPTAIYNAAQIPLPAPPSAPPLPGVPDSVLVTLQTGGAVTLSWEAANAAASSGVVYIVERKLPGQAAFAVVGFSPGSTVESRRMSWTDAAIPTSAAGQGVQYVITGQRSGQSGPASTAITVEFGVDGATVTGATLAMAA